MAMSCIYDGTENHNRIFVTFGYTQSINNCHICVTFGRSLSKTYPNLDSCARAKLVPHTLHKKE